MSDLGAFPGLVDAIAEDLPAVLTDVKQRQAELLDVSVDALRLHDRPGARDVFGRERPAAAEIFVADLGYVVAELRPIVRPGGVSHFLVDEDTGEEVPVAEPGSDGYLQLSWIGAHTGAEVLEAVADRVQAVLGIRPVTYHFTSRRLEELRAEAVTEEFAVDDAARRAARALGDRGARTLAVAIKSSGGLLLQDAPKQLPAESRADAERIQTVLRDAGVIAAEVVVVCNATNSQVARVPTAEKLASLSGDGLRCACGRPIDEERPEELLTVTDLGRWLLDKSRWMSVQVRDELIRLGVPEDQILLECQIGGEEIDCLANVSGELVVFELKDKEFSIGNAYSFGAKLGFLRPEHAVIITSDYVGNDVKQHFQRTSRAGRQQQRAFGTPRDPAGNINYIEGIETFAAGLEGVVAGIYRRDARAILNDALDLMAPSAGQLLSRLEQLSEASSTPA